MKRVILILSVFLLTAATWAQDSKGIYNKYSECEEVSAVYISSAMFKLMGKIPDMEMGNNSINLSSIVKNLNSLYILDCDDHEISSNIKSDLSKYINKEKFEMLIEIKDKNEIVRIYSQGNDKTVSQFIMTASEEEAFTLICMDGAMSRTELEKLIAKATQEMK